MFSGSGFDFGMQFSELTQDDGSDGFIKEIIKYSVQQPQRRGDVRTVGVSGKAKEMLSSIVYDTDTFRRIEYRANIATCQYLRPRFVNYRRILMNNNAEKFITTSRRKASKIVFKTVNGGIDFVLIAYLGLFDFSSFNPEYGKRPILAAVCLHGNVYEPEVRENIKALVGEENFDEDAFKKLFQAMLKN